MKLINVEPSPVDQSRRDVLTGDAALVAVAGLTAEKGLLKRRMQARLPLPT